MKRKPTPTQTLQAKVTKLEAELEVKDQALDTLVDILWPRIKDRVSELVEDAVSSTSMELF